MAKRHWISESRVENGRIETQLFLRRVEGFRDRKRKCVYFEIILVLFSIWEQSKPAKKETWAWNFLPAAEMLSSLFCVHGLQTRMD